MNIFEYVWMGLNEQDSEYASGPKYAKFWIWQGYQYLSVTQLSEYVRICLDHVPNTL